MELIVFVTHFFHYLVANLIYLSNFGNWEGFGHQTATLNDFFGSRASHVLAIQSIIAIGKDEDSATALC